MDDLDFLHDDNSGLSNATLKTVLPSGQVCHVSDSVNPYRLIDSCPLLFHAFEVNHWGHFQANIDAPSPSAVIALLRFCYTGSHLIPCVEDKDMSLLFHVHVYKLAVDFDLPELQLSAHGGFTCHVESAACRPDPPMDLLDTIRYIYQHFADEQSRYQHGLVVTLRNYCMATYMYHNLGHSQEFLTIVSEVPAFGQDLCRTNMERDFEDDCASAIIGLPPYHTGGPSESISKAFPSGGLPYQTLHDSPPDLPKVSLIDEINKEFNAREHNHTDSDKMVTSTATLVHRPLLVHLQALTASLSHDLSSDEEGFTMVHRPKPLAHGTNDESMSSPEVVSSAPLNVLAATGSDYPSDDEWSML